MRRKGALLSAFVSAAVALIWAAPALAQPPQVLVDDSTPARYNAALGTSLDASQAQFPCADSACGDPILSPAPEPDLSSASAVLGGWLSNPPSFNANWSGPQAIPLTWGLNTETAIVYEIDAGACGAKKVTGSFGVDNGIFVWVNGVYAFGALAPGTATAGEYVAPLGNMSPGTNFVQVLREDHGLATGYTVEISGKVKACRDEDEDDDDEDEDDDDGDGDDDDGDGDDDGDDDGDRGDDD